MIVLMIDLGCWDLGFVFNCGIAWFVSWKFRKYRFV